MALQDADSQRNGEMESSKPEKAPRPSPLACIECRKKHLKCDAVVPVCSRCTSRGLLCSYTPSRRGISGRTRRLQSPRHVDPAPPPTPAYERPGYTQPLQHNGKAKAPVPSRPLPEFRPPSPRGSWTDLSETSRLDSGGSGHSNASTPASTWSHSSMRSEDERLTNLYYLHFHPSHPMLVPRCKFYSQCYPESLRAVVRLIGSHYASGIASDGLRRTMAAHIADVQEKTPETVQALVLFAIALHARFEPMDAMPAITGAANLAIELGMNYAEFACRHAQGDLVYEESLRRTWWELYVTDGYLAALHRNISFRCNTVSASTLMPCEEAAYNDCAIPSRLLSLQQFDGRLFSDDDMHFSSFPYRIDAVRILSRVMAVSTANEVHADVIQTIDNAIAGWRFHIPHSKSEIINHSGELDPIMFQAYTIISCASIFLHFPRSELAMTMPPAAEIACAQRHMEQATPTSTQHAIKTMAASKDLANLAALPTEEHSPFFICGLVFACIVQLSACSAYSSSSKAEQNRERVALIIGVLKALSRNWAIAEHVGGQLKKAANEIFNTRSEVCMAPSSNTNSYNNAMDFSAMPSELSWLDFLDGMQGPMLLGPDMSGMQSFEG